MEILVVGTGALACLFAARLTVAGNRVTMLGSWPQGLAALRLNGVRLRELDGRLLQLPIEVIQASNPHRNFRYALVLIKSWQTARVAKQLASCLSADGVALTLQNGFGNVETLQAALGEARVALGVTTLGAKMVEPGYAEHTGQGKVMIGTHARLQMLAKKITQAGFVVELIDDPQALLWGKLVVNAAINPLTALLRVPNGGLLMITEVRELMAAAAEEAAMVATQRGVRLPYPDPVMAVEDVARNTAANTSSMLQDVLRGTPTEINAINGAIVQIGEKEGVPTPINRVLWQLVRGLDYHEGKNSDDRG
jgi:2-dehydropantoate 2-reductase